MPAKFLAIAKLHWLNTAHGGRKKPPVGSTYAATGRFASDKDQLFSLVLRFRNENALTPQSNPKYPGLRYLNPRRNSYRFRRFEKSRQRTLQRRVGGIQWYTRMPIKLEQAELGFLAPELVVDKLAPGVKLLITEGPKTVAECEIISVTQAGLLQAETAHFKNR
jgi:hypothetical protein